MTQSQIVLKAQIDTWLTRQKSSITELSDAEKSLLPAKTELPILSYRADEEYFQITLVRPINTETNWYVKASPEIEFSDVQLQSFLPGPTPTICDETC